VGFVEGLFCGGKKGWCWCWCWWFWDKGRLAFLFWKMRGFWHDGGAIIERGKN